MYILYFDDKPSLFTAVCWDLSITKKGLPAPYSRPPGTPKTATSSCLPAWRKTSAGTPQERGGWC